MDNSSLLCTFTKKKNLDITIKLIKETYKSVTSVFVLQNVDGVNEFYCTYNALTSELKEKGFLKNTISIHRNKNTNTLYTINAVNSIIYLLNDGNIDSSFKIEWERFRNMLIVTNEFGIKKINTKLFKVI